MNETLRRENSRASYCHAALLLGTGAPGRRPKARKTDFNLHAYVGADPVNFTDPAGLKRKKPDIPPKHDGGGGGGGGAGDIIINGNRADQALRDTLIMLNRIATHEFIHNSSMGSNGETSNEDIVITGRRPERSDSENLPPPMPSPSGFILAGGGFDSGLPRDPGQLEKMLEEAKKAGDNKLARRIIRQQKMLGVRNVGKMRGLGRFRGPVLILPDWLDHFIRCYPGNRDPECLTV